MDDISQISGAIAALIFGKALIKRRKYPHESAVQDDLCTQRVLSYVDEAASI